MSSALDLSNRYCLQARSRHWSHTYAFLHIHSLDQAGRSMHSRTCQSIDDQWTSCLLDSWRNGDAIPSFRYFWAASPLPWRRQLHMANELAHSGSGTGLCVGGQVYRRYTHRAIPDRSSAVTYESSAEGIGRPWQTSRSQNQSAVYCSVEAI